MSEWASDRGTIEAPELFIKESSKVASAKNTITLLYNTVLFGYCDNSLIATVLECINQFKNGFYYCEIIGYCDNPLPFPNSVTISEKHCTTRQLLLRIMFPLLEHSGQEFTEPFQICTHILQHRFVLVKWTNLCVCEAPRRRHYQIFTLVSLSLSVRSAAAAWSTFRRCFRFLSLIVQCAICH